MHFPRHMLLSIRGNQDVVVITLLLGIDAGVKIYLDDLFVLLAGIGRTVFEYSGETVLPQTIRHIIRRVRKFREQYDLALRFLPEEIMDFCKNKLAAYKVPKIVEFIDTLPKSPVGKILRKELRKMELDKGK